MHSCSHHITWSYPCNRVPTYITSPTRSSLPTWRGGTVLSSARGRQNSKMIRIRLDGNPAPSADRVGLVGGGSRKRKKEKPPARSAAIPTLCAHTLSTHVYTRHAAKGYSI